MNKHIPGTYPMYHTEKIIDRTLVENTITEEYRRVTMSHTQEIKIGDRIQYKSKFDLTFIVTEIHEKRVAKGNHPSAETLFYDLSLKYKIHEQ